MSKPVDLFRQQSVVCRSVNFYLVSDGFVCSKLIPKIHILWKQLHVLGNPIPIVPLDVLYCTITRKDQCRKQIAIITLFYSSTYMLAQRVYNSLYMTFVVMQFALVRIFDLIVCSIVCRVIMYIFVLEETGRTGMFSFQRRRVELVCFRFRGDGQNWYVVGQYVY